MQTRGFAVLLLLLMAPYLSCLAKEPPAPRVVDLSAVDGVQLKASYFSSGKLGPGVLLLHQCDHERAIWDGLARQLAAAGINVLTFDLRGFGESGGVRHDKAPPLGPPEQVEKWPGDIDLAFQYLKTQTGVKPDAMGVGGASCGVDNAIKTAMRHPEVKSLVLLAGPTDIKGRQFLRQAKLPVFFAVADDDQSSFMVQWTEFLYAITADPGKKFAHYQTGHHGAEIFSVHPDLPAAIVDWYITTLIKTPGRAPVPKKAPAILSQVRNWDFLEQPGGPDKLAQMLSAARHKDPEASIASVGMFSESGQKGNPIAAALELAVEMFIDNLANENFDAGDAQQGMEIAKLDVLAYPNSPVAYGLLSEGYLAQGQKVLARQNANKALDLLSSDTVYPQYIHDVVKDGIKQILQQLGEPQ